MVSVVVFPTRAHMSGADRNQQSCVDAALRLVDRALAGHKILRNEIRAGRVRVDSMVEDALPEPPAESDNL